MNIIKGNLKSLNYKTLSTFLNIDSDFVVIDTKQPNWQEQILSLSSSNLFDDSKTIFIKNPNKDYYDFIKNHNHLINNPDIFIVQEDSKSKSPIKLNEITINKLTKKEIQDIASKKNIDKSILKIYESKLSDNIFILYNQLNLISNISNHNNPAILDFDLEPKKIYLLSNDFINMDYNKFKETYNHYFLTMSEIGIFYFLVSSFINMKSSYYSNDSNPSYFVSKQLQIINKIGIKKFNDLLIYMSDIDLKYKKGIIKQELVIKLIFNWKDNKWN